MIKNRCDSLHFLRIELETFEGTTEANKIFMRFCIGAFTEEGASGGFQNSVKLACFLQSMCRKFLNSTP